VRRHFANAAYGVLDYVSYPLGMLMVAPIVLHKLGPAEYGLWAISTAVISAGGILASGFCDANIQRVARLRGSNNNASMQHTVRSMLGINLVFGSALGLIAWFAAPFAARHISVSHPAQFRDCLICMRIASVLILVRAIESVTVSTQRAFERYSFTVRINTLVRLLTLGSAALLAWCGLRTVSILAETAFFLAVGTFLQFREAQRILGSGSLWPVFQPEETRILLGFGVFSWMQALGGVIFSQFDRLLLGLSLGALAVAPYSLCVQFSQPVFGLTASGLQFLFPYLSGRVGTISNHALKRTLWKAFVCNLLLVAVGAGALLLIAGRLIKLWAGPAVAQSAAAILPPIVLGSALMGLSVTGTYAMLALGLFRTVALISLSARGLMLLLMTYLIHHNGIQGLAISRSFYGLLALMVYLPLIRRLAAGRKASDAATPVTQIRALQEVSEP
jgi:O-antigen/teichoic acid export membrane protein